MADTVDEIQGLTANLDMMLDEAAALMERVPAFMLTVEKDRLAQLVLAVDDLKSKVDTGKTAVNVAQQKLEEHFAKVLIEGAVDDETMKYRTDEATFSPSVKGYFSVSKPKEFLEHLGGDIDKLCEMLHSKEAIRQYCEGKLENGEPMPPGISKHIVANVHIRRKK